MSYRPTNPRQSATAAISDISQLVSLLAGGLLAIGGLLHLRSSLGVTLPWTDVTGWLEGSAEDVLLSSLWIVALGLAGWVTATTILYTLARLTRVPSAIRAVEWATLPAIRRMAERAVAVSLAASTLVGSGGVAALASEHGPSSPPVTTAVVLNVGDVSPSNQSEHTGLRPPAYVPTLAGDVSDSSADQDQPATDDVVAPTSEPASSLALLGIAGGMIEGLRGPTTYTVQVGDNFWAIAERHAATATGQPPSQVETARYWAILVEANREVIRSGDPDLIFPGEQIECPPVEFDTQPPTTNRAERAGGMPQ